MAIEIVDLPIKNHDSFVSLPEGILLPLIPFWLVVLTILNNMKSMGRIIPYIMENKNVWNHQPAI